MRKEQGGCVSPPTLLHRENVFPAPKTWEFGSNFKTQAKNKAHPRGKPGIGNPLGAVQPLPPSLPVGTARGLAPRPACPPEAQPLLLSLRLFLLSCRLRGKPVLSTRVSRRPSWVPRSLRCLAGAFPYEQHAGCAVGPGQGRRCLSPARCPRGGAGRVELGQGTGRTCAVPTAGPVGLPFARGSGRDVSGGDSELGESPHGTVFASST